LEFQKIEQLAIFERFIQADITNKMASRELVGFVYYKSAIHRNAWGSSPRKLKI
jgi:hypothetical protein